MDLFGRKARRELEYEKQFSAQMLALTEAAMELVEQLRYKETLTQGALDRLAALVNEKQAKIQELEAAISTRPQPIMRKYPLYKSEEEEELEYAFRNGDIDKREYRDMMSQLGFDNVEVEIPDAPERPQLY
jgi:hypothetical protein